LTSNLTGNETRAQFEKVARKQSGFTGYESSAVYDSKNRLILMKDGEDSYIEFSEYEVDRIKGAKVFTHNHPSGSSFSHEDITFMSMNEITEMRAVGEKFNYSITGKPIKPAAANGYEHAMTTEEVIGRRWQQYFDDDFPKYSAQVTKGTMTEQDAIQAHTHGVMERLSAEFGMDYKRTLARKVKGSFSFSRVLKTLYNVFMQAITSKSGGVTRDAS